MFSSASASAPTPASLSIAMTIAPTVPMVSPQVLSKPTLQVSWSTKKGHPECDVDGALIMYNVGGQLLQVCFDKVSFPGVSHSGDSIGANESMTIDFANVPGNVQYIVFVVTIPPAKNRQNEPITDIFSSLDVQCAQFGYRASLLDLLEMVPEAKMSHNFAPLLCVRQGNTPQFQLHQVGVFDASKEGQIEGQIGGLENVWRLAEHVVHGCVDPVIWNEFPHSHVEMLRLKKNQTVHLPTKLPSASNIPKTIASLPHTGTFAPLRMIGLRWTPSQIPGKKFDLDLHVWLLDVDTKTVLSHCYYGNKTSSDGAIKLSGDDLTGDGDESEDDEQMFVDLTKVDKKVDAIFIGVQIFTGQTFAQVSNEACRAVDVNGHEMARFTLDKDPNFEKSSAAVMCVLRRDPKKIKEGGWMMNTVGEAVSRTDLDQVHAYKTLAQFL